MIKCPNCETWLKDKKALRKHVEAKHNQIEITEGEERFTDNKKELVKSMKRIKESIKFRTKLMLIERINKNQRMKIKQLEKEKQILRKKNDELNKTLDHINKKLEKMLRSKKAEIDKSSSFIRSWFQLRWVILGCWNSRCSGKYRQQ